MCLHLKRECSKVFWKQVTEYTSSMTLQDKTYMYIKVSNKKRVTHSNKIIKLFIHTYMYI